MAGKVARYPTTQLRNVDYVSQNNFGRDMEEDHVLSDLRDTSFDRRADVLEQLRASARRNGGRLPFPQQRNIFKGLSYALNDSNWDVRMKCLQLVHDVLPFLDDELDECMFVLLPNLIPKLGDSKVTVRRAVIQTIHVYMGKTLDVEQVLRSVVRYGLENPDPRIKKEVTIALPMLFTPDFRDRNFYDVAQSLAKQLLESSSTEDGESLQQHALLSLSKIENLVGREKFKMYTDKLSPPLRNYYFKLVKNDVGTEFASGGDGSRYSYGTNGVNSPSRTSSMHNASDLYADAISDSYEFGVVPSHLMDKLNDQTNFRTRAQAVEELKLAIKELDYGSVHHLEPHILNFISFLNNLLDDTNFKIQISTLEILSLLVDKLQVKMKHHLKPMILALTKRMGDHKIVIRQIIMRVIVKQLMHVLSPKPVLNVVCDNLSHKNSKVRQETLNIVIASLITFPSDYFDKAFLCQAIAHTLLDQKRPVRQAALECFAMLAQAMGAGKLQPLVQAVDSVELSYDGDGVMGAVQARLARRQLPKLNADMLVDYATPIPNSAGSRAPKSSVNLPPGADIEWILQAPSGTSARTDRSDMDLKSIGGSNRSSPVQEYSSPKRQKSGKRLPWNNDSEPRNNKSSVSTV